MDLICGSGASRGSAEHSLRTTELTCPLPSSHTNKTQRGNSSWQMLGTVSAWFTRLTERWCPQEPCSLNWGTRTRVHKDSPRLILFRRSPVQRSLLVVRFHSHFHISPNSLFVKEMITSSPSCFTIQHCLGG